MGVSRIRRGEIIEVAFLLPNGKSLHHPALVLSPEQLLDDEDGMFYAVLISTKNYHPEYTIKIKNEWLTKPLSGESYFVTHIISFFKLSHVIRSNGSFIKEPFFMNLLFKINKSIFDLELEEE
jgi:hypothetical protein